MTNKVAFFLLATTNLDNITTKYCQNLDYFIRMVVTSSDIITINASFLDFFNISKSGFQFSRIG